jgi:hypothetical protein
MRPCVSGPKAAHGLLLGLLVMLLTSACTDNKADCLGDAKVCGGTCVELVSDNLNCGACGTACGAGLVCSSGSCQVTCAVGLVKVAGACVNPLTDRTHCGATASSGGTACDAGSVCSAGSCALSCQAGLVDCNGKCVDTLSDRNHCGAAAACAGGSSCAAGQLCSSGSCQLSCATGQVEVAGACVDPLTDRSHCGATTSSAGTACAAGSVCSAGACTVSCQAGLSACGGKCVDPQTDVLHCGADAACAGGTSCGVGQACAHGACVTPSCSVFQFVYTSDPHYGITRTAFQGGANVNAQLVNQRMIAKINGLPAFTLPADGGLKAGLPVGPVDFLVETGDVSNRMETASSVPAASVTWAQFKGDYLDGLTLRDAFGRTAPVLLAPGNHDISNAIGYYKAMSPLIDQTTVVEIYNRMLAPATPRTPTVTGVSTGTYDYATDKVHYSRDIGGVHFVFVNMWPDSLERAWLDANLAAVPAGTPVILFTHDQPETEPKHYTNPVSPFTINATNKFENLIADTFADGTTITTLNLVEQQALAAWLSAHPNVVAYFHGNDNQNEFYDWTGKNALVSPAVALDLGVLLHTFRVDSPMKGNVSGSDETKLSFQLYTVDTCAMQLTGRELLWNTQPAAADQATVPVVAGASRTVPLTPRPGFTTPAAPQSVAAGATATFTLVASGAPTFQWSSKAPGATAWTAIPGATAASYTTPVTVVGDSGTQYRCLATNASGQASSVATLTVTP